MDEWMDVKAILRIAYSNQNISNVTRQGTTIMLKKRGIQIFKLLRVAMVLHHLRNRYSIKKIKSLIKKVLPPKVVNVLNFFFKYTFL
jgi:hypothetical protein